MAPGDIPACKERLMLTVRAVRRRAGQPGWLAGGVFPVFASLPALRSCPYRPLPCSLNIWHAVITSSIAIWGPHIENHSFYVIKVILKICNRVQTEFTFPTDGTGKSWELTGATCNFVPNELWLWVCSSLHGHLFLWRWSTGQTHFKVRKRLP